MTAGVRDCSSMLGIQDTHVNITQVTQDIRTIIIECSRADTAPHCLMTSHIHKVVDWLKISANEVYVENVRNKVYTNVFVCCANGFCSSFEEKHIHKFQDSNFCRSCF